ncbi:uncharacterized protein LOC128861170 [Anastrepha ludens]|uniref:uncharacterized protein LOC128861170 n=1 Tax=Anastrepha ludens TaxID=28586 RepID=UPI0023AFC0BF|nr:uncharacterized protein LOC128861170 [Anastrepha ludens]
MPECTKIGNFLLLPCGKTKTVNENAEQPTAKESNFASKSMQAHILNPNLSLTADENLSKEEDLTQLKISQLRAQLRVHGLSPVGKKDVLVQRLQNYLQLKAKNTITHKSFDMQDDQTKTRITEEKLLKDEKLTEEGFNLAARNEKLSHEAPQSEINVSETKISGVHRSSIVDQHTEEPSLAKLNELSLPPIAEKAAANADKGVEKSNGHLTSTSELVASPKISGKSAADDGTNDDNDDRHEDDDEKFQNHSYIKHSVENVVGKQAEGDVCVEYIQGLPHLTVPLPSRLEKCRFALRPVSHKVGDLIEMLKIEDHGIDRAIVLNQNGIRISSTCSIDSLMDEPFWLQINDNKYEVIPPKRKKIDSEDLKNLNDIRTLVAQLYEALHVGEYHLQKEEELVKRIEKLKFEIAPLEIQKQELARLAERKTVVATWVGLSLMAVQFGVLARLTWWEYSWDIMEPVTYFVTYGTTMAMYAYYCLTKTEYNCETARDRMFLLTIHKKAKRKRMNIENYNVLKRLIAEAEYDLRRLRDPINLQLPPHMDRAQRLTPIEPLSDDGTETQHKTSERKAAGFRLPFLEPKN